MARPKPMRDVLQALAERAAAAELNSVRGTVLLEVGRGRSAEPWLVSIDRGAVTVAQEAGPADAILRGDRAVFERLAAGEVSFVTAMLRGDLVAEGDRRLLVRFQRLLPPPSKRTSRRLIKASGSRT